MNDIVVRTADVADIGDISRVLAASWRTAYRGIVDAHYLDQIADDRWVQPLREELAAGTTDAIVACYGVQITGAVLMRKSKMVQYPDDGELSAVYLHPDWVGKGVGQILIDRALHELCNKGFAHAVLDVLIENQRAKRFYHKNGFEFTGHTVELTLGTQVLCEIMRKEL